MALKRMVAKVQVTLSVEFEYDDDLELDANDQALEELANQLTGTGLTLDESEGALIIESASESEKFC